ncbi:hypothetical protein ACXIUS_21670 [Bosea thiooxidans]|nr:hypothetical protein [Bosea sp. (in: a-proteobacteria)]
MVISQLQGATIESGTFTVANAPLAKAPSQAVLDPDGIVQRQVIESGLDGRNGHGLSLRWLVVPRPSP